MPFASTTSHQTLSLVDIIDFKWLMAGDGHRVHVEQLQADPTYARQCLVLGANSRVPALRDTAKRLAAMLDVVLPCTLATPAPTTPR